jgi:hypothetical protein
MPPKAPIDWHSPLSCPRCETESGHPFYVQSKGSKEVVVRVRCGACAHEWLIERETPTFTGEENTD